MGIRAHDLKHFVIRPVLCWMGPLIPYSRYAENQLLGTAAQESAMSYFLDQTAPGPGPGFGPYQMEEETFQGHCDWMIRFNKGLWKMFQEINIPPAFHRDGPAEMAGNLYLATFMCRVHYYRIRQLMPQTLEGQAKQWKQFYNTWKGKGTVEQYISNYKKLVGEEGEF